MSDFLIILGFTLLVLVYLAAMGYVIWLLDGDEFRAVRREALEEAEKKAEAELASRDAKIIRLSDTITGLRETCDELRRQLSEARATLGGVVTAMEQKG